MILSGLVRLGADGEGRYLTNGDFVLDLRAAWNYGKRDQQLPQWIDLAMFGKRAESLAPHMKKGKQLFVVAEDPHIETFTKRDGDQGHKMVAKIVTFEFAGGARDGGQDRAPEQHDASANDYDDDVPL